MAPKLTIGFAHFDDYDGAYFTLQALRMYHPAAMPQVELLCVDNSPHTPAGKAVAGLFQAWVGKGVAGAKYVPYTQAVGTSQSRNAIFEHATGDAVMVLDCHVLLAPGAVDRLVEYLPTLDNDLGHGPLLYDDLGNYTTHFDDNWRAEMWGTWGLAWACPCAATGVAPMLFSTHDVGGAVAYRNLTPGMVPATQCRCGKPLPTGVTWVGHETRLEELGYIRWGKPAHAPFEVPGMGLGLFVAKRATWLGFNRDARGFGGEEMYIHEKYRQHGRRVLCLPWLRWLHRFGRPGGVKYPLTRWNKVRNYVLEHKELGLDMKPVYDHFVASGLFPQRHWDYLLEDPVARAAEPAPPQAQGCGVPCGQGDREDALDKAQTLPAVYDKLATMPRDLDRHMPKLRELAASVANVTEFSKRRESTVALLRGLMDAAAKSTTTSPVVMLTTYNTEQDWLMQRLPKFERGGVGLAMAPLASDQVPKIEPTDLLFIDSRHTYATLYGELQRYAPAVRRYIVCHDTRLHSERGEDGGPGLLTALRQYMLDHPEWSVVWHTDDQYGLTVLGRLPEDKPALPSVWTMAANFAGAVASYTLSGGANTSLPVLEARLGTCSVCPHRVDDRCSVCGCLITAKAAMRDQPCPLGKWPMEGGAQ